MRKRFHSYIPIFAAIVLSACGDDRAVDDRDAAEESVVQSTVRVDTTVPPPLVDVPTPDAVPQTAQGPTPEAPNAGAEPAAEPGPVATEEPVPTPQTPRTPLPAARAASSPASDVLARAEEAYSRVRSMEADFIQRVDVQLLDTVMTGRGKIYHRTPDRFSMRFTDPAGDLIVADGAFAWLYYPSTDPVAVMKSRLSEGGQQVDLQREFLSDATSRFNATLEGTESVGGRRTHLLTLVPRGASPYRRVRLWVDQENLLVRRFEITEENESVRTVELSNIRTNVPLDDELFRFVPPPGTQVFEP